MDALTAIFERILRMEAVWCINEPEEEWTQLPVVSSGPVQQSEMKIFLFARVTLEGIFCHLRSKEFWQMRVYKEESDYSGIQ